MKIIYQSNITKKKIKLKQETNQFIYVLVFLFASLKLFAQSTNKDSLNFSVQIIKIEQQLLNAIPTGDTTVWSKYLDKTFILSLKMELVITGRIFLPRLVHCPKDIQDI